MMQSVREMFIEMRTENQNIRNEMRAENQTLKEELAQMRNRMSQPNGNRTVHRETVPSHNNCPLNNAQPTQPHNTGVNTQWNQQAPHHTQIPISFHNLEQIHSPVSTPSQEQHASIRLQQDKAFQSLIKLTTSKFNGKDVLEYAPWKKSLNHEIENLNLTPTQKIKLIEARTELAPHQIVKDLRCIEIEMGPELSLIHI